MLLLIFIEQKIYISIDIWMYMQREIERSPFARAPTLGTVLMVEKTIEKHSGEFNRTEIWKRLPRKVMWQTYLVVIDYLQSVNKVALADNGVLVYIWSPEAGKRFAKRKSIEI